MIGLWRSEYNFKVSKGVGILANVKLNILLALCILGAFKLSALYMGQTLK